MRLRWNEESKKLLLSLGLFLVLSLVLGNLVISFYQNRMRSEYNLLVANMIETVQKAYPQASEPELISMLETEELSAEGERILARYGIFTENGSKTFSRQERQITFFRIGMNFFLLGILAVGIGLVLADLQSRQKRIEQLQRYMERLQRGDYRMELEENGDDELSGLRNEVYRLTVLLKETAALAQQRRQALADSVTNISHQLKTPLTSMTILLDNLLEDEEMDEITRHRFLAEINRQLTGMSWLIATLLKLSRLEAGVAEFERKPVEVQKLVEECLSRLETAAEWKGITLETRLQPGAVLTVDENWTLEALCNIVKNAIEHSPSDSSVQIRASENDVYIEINVLDSGTGIPKEEREKLFQRFYRGSNAAEDSIGIGLALAKEVVEQQHGRIEIESEEGQGTLFSLKFMK